jgi:hypothetical protein
MDQDYPLPIPPLFLAITLVLICTLCAGAAVPFFPPASDAYALPNGYALEKSTGKVYSPDGTVQAFTFAYGTVTGPPDIHTGIPVVTELNPMEYASKSTADKVLAFVQGVDSNALAYQLQPYGPYVFSEPQRFIAAYGQYLNAGLIAEELIFTDVDTVKKRIAAELNTARNSQN